MEPRADTPSPSAAQTPLPQLRWWARWDEIQSDRVLSHVLVDCGLRGVALAGGYGGFCQIKIAPLYPNSRKDHDFGGKN